MALIGSGLDHHESSAMGSEEGLGLHGGGHATVKTGANERSSPDLQPGCGFRDIVRERMWLPGLVLQKRLVGQKTQPRDQTHVPLSQNSGTESLRP